MPNNDSETPNPIDDEFENDEFTENEFEEDELDSELDAELEKELENISPSTKESPLETISIADIPIKIQIEVSRFEVSLDELSRMEPGYKLPIEINPRLVHLTSSGKVIGKGEIIEIGDTIGVKILELYK